VWPWVPALARVAAPHAKRRAEARARPGHERVAADAMALRHRADGLHRVVSYSPCQTAQFLLSRNIFASGFSSFLFTFAAADPRARGLAERRETSSLVRVAQVTRDATLARHGPSRATGRPASRRSAVALSAQVPPPSPLPGPARRLHAPLARLPGCGCRAFRIRGYQPRSTPHPAPPSGSPPDDAPHERDFGFIAYTH
jgi:hypothetical protein